MKNIHIVLLVGLGAVLGYLIALALMVKLPDQAKATPTNFEECATAGNAVMESYPRQCRSKEGKLFVEGESAPKYKKCTNVGDRVCVDSEKAGSTLITTDIQARDACRRAAKCEVQADGECGWTQTAKFKACLQSPPPLPPLIDRKND